MSHTPHFDESQLLELLLEADAEGRAVADACPQCSEALADLEQFLGQCRTAAGRVDGEQVASLALAERVLAHTTREDLGWRGDLHLLGGFLGQRLRASPVLRFAAASLLVHLFALPVLAWFALREAPSEDMLHFAIDYPREQTLPDVPPEPERTPEMPQSESDSEWTEELVLVEVSGDRGAAARRAERAFLSAAAVPNVAVDAVAADEPLARLLAARSVRLSDGRLVAFLEREAPPQDAGTVELALWAEVLMDHVVLAEERLAGLDASLGRLLGEPALEGPEGVLGGLALRRARDLGLFDEERTKRVGAALTQLGLPLWRDASGDAATWSGALAAALAGTDAAGSEAARAWSRWGR
jgi:hypothetical protein